MTKEKKILAGLSIAAFLAPFTQTVYTPSLPEISGYFAANTFMVNLTISIFTFILSSSQFIIGPLADTRGRKAILLPGLLLFMAGSLICLLTQNYYLFLVGRAVQAFGISTGSVVAAAVIGDIYAAKDRGKAMSVYQTMVFIGPVFGPVLGSFVSGFFHWKGIFLVLLVLALISFIYNRIVLYETLPKDLAPVKITFRTFKEILFNRASFSIMLLGFIQFYGYYVLLVFLPGLLQNVYDMSVTSKGLFYIPLTAGLLLGSAVGGRLQGYFTRKTILIGTSYGISLIVLIFCFYLMFNILPKPILITFLLLYGMSLGIGLPAQTTTLINLFHEKKGTAIGTYNFIRFSGAGVGPLLGAVFHHIGGDKALYFSLFTFMLIAAVVIHKHMQEPYMETRAPGLDV
ncbi:MFS transporter [Bacillus sp. M6-12]|uniref:MFS transporter n=1 Tax=Bacillus sp. M6-12 TaxID=2054166 RepID=UPI000C7795A3|nr:MFS transporter [Bacillus sp. M6-12]PLS18579.1 MFS transporter [Bacillus sp. M6-12]